MKRQGLGKKKAKDYKNNIRVLLLTGVLFSLLTGMQASAAQAELDGKTREQLEAVKIEGNSLRFLVADILAVDPNQTLWEEDLIDWIGKMETSNLVLESGEDMEFAAKYFNCLNVTEISVYNDFKWNNEQYQMLSLFTGLKKLSIETKGNHLSMDAVEKLPKLEELTFDVKDATALHQFKLPDHVKTLRLFTRKGNAYQELFASLTDSSVTDLHIYMEKDDELTLDAIADCISLERLNIYDGFLSIENIERKWNLDRLEELTFSADRRTDLRFVKELPSLKYVEVAITETVDVTPLFERKELSMYLFVARENAESEDDRYPDNQVIDIDLEEFTSLKAVEMEQGDYLAAFQQYFDEEKRIECFVLRTGLKEEEIFNREPVIIVSGDKFYQVLQFEEEEHDVFGVNRSDRVSVQDINFDNKKDITLDGGEQGNRLGHHCFAWCWDERLQEYVYCSSYSRITNPWPDTKKSYIWGHWKNGLASQSWGIYEYVNGEFLETTVITESLLLNAENQEVLKEWTQVWEWTVEELVDGELQQTENFTVTKIPGQPVVYPEAYYRLKNSIKN